jgi:hypothetical protein
LYIAVNWDKKMSELKECTASWLDMDAGSFTEGYFSTVEAYVGYFVHGGKGRISEHKVKKMWKEGYEGLDGSATHRDKTMQELYDDVPNLPRLRQQKIDATKKTLFDCLRPYFHELNWLRKRRGIELAEAGLPDLDKDSDDENAD